MLYRLIIVTGPMTGQRVTVPETPLVIGRDPDCGFCVQDADVARRHAAITIGKDGLGIRDLGTMNRLIVNGREVRESRLKHGDEVEIGRTRFVVQAVVETDVDGRRQAKRRRRGKVMAALGAIAVLAVAAYWRWSDHADQSAAVPKPPSPPPETRVSVPEPSALTNLVEVRPLATNESASGAVAAENSERMSEEIRRLTMDLVALRTTVQMIAASSVTSRADRAAGTPSLAVSVTAAVSAAVTPAVTGVSAATVAASVTGAKDKPASGVAPGPALSPPPFRGRISIASLDQRKFPASQDVDEMRLVDIGLAADPPDALPAVNLLRVQVMVFDRNAATGTPFLTRAIVRNPQFQASSEWQTNAVNLVSATYVVPRGARHAGGDPGPADEFCGYVVRVFYGNEFQSEESRPRDLARYAPPLPTPVERGRDVTGTTGGSKGSP